MSIEITKRGSLPGDRKASAECRNCSTQFTFQQSDAAFHSDQRDGDYYSVPCPLCSTSVIVSSAIAFPPRRA